MAIRLGDEAPNFTAATTDGTIDFYDYLGDGWGVLFSHPKDFTPVCTTELGRVAALKPEFDKRNVKVVGLSVDPLDSHEQWAGDIEETQGSKLNFPLIADPDRKVSDLYDMIHPNANDTLTVRSVFIVGPDKKVKLQHHLSREHGPELRRDPARHRLAPADRRLPGGDAGGLEGRRGRHHRPCGLRRGRQGEVPQGVQGDQAVPAGHAAAEQVDLSARPRWVRDRPCSARSADGRSPCSLAALGRVFDPGLRPADRHCFAAPVPPPALCSDPVVVVTARPAGRRTGARGSWRGRRGCR